MNEAVNSYDLNRFGGSHPVPNWEINNLRNMVLQLSAEVDKLRVRVSYLSELVSLMTNRSEKITSYDLEEIDKIKCNERFGKWFMTKEQIEDCDGV